jgi:hypothetical protein
MSGAANNLLPSSPQPPSDGLTVLNKKPDDAAQGFTDININLFSLLDGQGWCRARDRNQNSMLLLYKVLEMKGV